MNQCQDTVIISRADYDHMQSELLRLEKEIESNEGLLNDLKKDRNLVIVRESQWGTFTGLETVTQIYTTDKMVEKLANQLQDTQDAYRKSKWLGWLGFYRKHQ